MADADTGMSKAEMKKLLQKSKQEPVNAAFALGADATVGLLLLDKMKQPRALEKLLEKQFADAKNTRFGTALVDEEQDPKLVKFVVNRQVSGMARKLAKTLKGTGFNKVEIVLEDATAVDSYSGAEEEEKEGEQHEAAPPQAAAPPAAPPAPDLGALQRRLAGLIPRVGAAADPAGKATLVKLATTANAELKANNLAAASEAIGQLEQALDAAPAPAAPAIPAAPPNPAAGDAQKLLAGLIGRVAGVADAGQKAALAGLAREANAALKTGDLDAATRGIEALRAGLDAPAEAGAETGAETGTVAPAEAGAEVDFPKLWDGAAKRWQDASDSVDDQVSKLQQALKASDDDELHDIAEFGLNGITGGTKVKLMAAIRDISQAGATVPPGMVGKANQAVAQFRQQIGGDDRVDACDANPFGVAVSIRQTFAPALAGLEAALKAAGTVGQGR